MFTYKIYVSLIMMHLYVMDNILGLLLFYNMVIRINSKVRV